MGWYAYSGGQYSQQNKLGNKLNPYRFFVTIEDRADSPYSVTTNPNEVKIKVLGEDSETGIDMVQEPKGSMVQDVIYDLQGRKVEKPGKGIYIVNGRKVAFK